MKKKVFVLGASGFQGAKIAAGLLAKNYAVTTLKRSAEKGMPANPKIRIVEGGLENKASLIAALDGVDSAVYTFPLIFDLDLAKEYTSNFIAAAKKQNVSLVVFNAGFDLPLGSSELLVIKLKSAIKDLFDTSGLKVITLMPDIYIDNIAAPWSLPVILKNGIVPYPVASGVKVPWVSHLDLAKYVVAAVDKLELAGQVLPIGGNLFTGEEISEAISAKIGKPLNYVGVTPDEFEQQISPTFGVLAGKEISNLYRYVDANHTSLIAKNFKSTQETLSVVPQSLTEWVDSINWTTND